MAQGTIPGSSLAIGGTSTIDAAGYFSDADGDELTYTGASSNEGVATVSMDGSSATITAVAAGDAVITITASDGSASASQGFTVTVAAAPANNPPVAVGTIPGSTLEIGGSSTIDAAGYFSDADGDELSYTGSSSNEGVATVAMDGSSATITAVAAGDAVITITASDGEASVSQGFRVDVSSGPKQATVAIFGVQDLSGGPVDPTNVYGKVNVLVNYEANDETVVGIELLVGGTALHCRGSTGSGESDLAGSGSQVEIPCVFNTAAVMGECMGSQLDPMFANGAVELGARIHTQGGGTRDALATQTVMLNNSNYVMVSHSPGSMHILKSGMPLYGGSSEADGNMNSFHACPVAYDGTMVGKMSLRALNTGADKATPHTAATSLSFTAPTTMPAASFNGMAADRESADGFTWDVNSAWNSMVEDEGPGGREHWVFAGETLEDGNGLDVSADFGIENPFGPFYFDFKAPVPGTIQVNKADPAGEHYSAAKDNAIALSSATDMGAGVDDASITIAVGDGSAEANKYDAKTKMPDRTMTPFDAMYASVSHISDLAEEDAVCTGKDDNGLDCYVAELTSLADKLGNAWSGGKTPASWLQTVAFGVDNTAAELDDIEPDLTGLVFRQEPEMDFEVRNPDLASGDDGTALTATVMSKDAAGKYTVDAGMVTLPEVGIDATVDLDEATLLAKEGAKTVRVTVADGATPPNTEDYTFSFVYDMTPATYSISATQGDINPGSASSVQVSVDGTVTDKFSNLETADLRLLIAPGGQCFEGTLERLEELEALGAEPDEADVMERDANILPGDRLGGSGKNEHKRSLADGTAKSASLSSTFTIMPAGAGESEPQMYCFRLDVEDVALAANGRASSTGNTDNFVVGPVFTVSWPDNKPDPDPVYQIVVPEETEGTEGVAGTNDANGDTTLDDPVNQIAVSLRGMHGAADPAEDVTVTITGENPVSVDTDLTTTGNQNTLTFTATNFGDDQYVYFTVGHDLNAATESRTITLTAESDDANYDGVSSSVTVETNDDDIEMWASVTSIGENDGRTKVIIEARAGGTSGAARVVTFAVGDGTSSSADYGVTDATTTDGTGTLPTTITIPADMLVGKDSVTLTPVDDAEIETAAEALSVAASAVDGNPPATGRVWVTTHDIAIEDADPDVMLSLSHDGTLDENSGETVVTVTATLVNGTAPEILDFTVSAASGCINATWSSPSGPLRIDGGASSGSVDVTVTASTNFNGPNEECDVAATTAENRPAAHDGSNVLYTIQAAELTIVNADGSDGTDD